MERTERETIRPSAVARSQRRDRFGTLPVAVDLPTRSPLLDCARFDRVLPIQRRRAPDSLVDSVWPTVGFGCFDPGGRLLPCLLCTESSSGVQSSPDQADEAAPEWIAARFNGEGDAAGLRSKPVVLFALTSYYRLLGLCRSVRGRTRYTRAHACGDSVCLGATASTAAEPSGSG